MTPQINTRGQLAHGGLSSAVRDNYVHPWWKRSDVRNESSIYGAG